MYLQELKREGAKDAEAVPLARTVASTLSGLACWPTLVLDPEGELVVRSRGVRGEHQKSHWQTVLPLLSARPQPVAAGDVVRITPTVELPERVNQPPKYLLRGEISRS